MFSNLWSNAARYDGFCSQNRSAGGWVSRNRGELSSTTLPRDVQLFPVNIDGSDEREFFPELKRYKKRYRKALFQILIGDDK